MDGHKPCIPQWIKIPRISLEIYKKEEITIVTLTAYTSYRMMRKVRGTLKGIQKQERNIRQKHLDELT